MAQMASKLMPFLIQQETMRAVDQLINRQALLSEATRMGLRVTPQEVQGRTAARSLRRNILPWRQFHRPDRNMKTCCSVPI